LPQSDGGGSDVRSPHGFPLWKGSHHMFIELQNQLQAMGYWFNVYGADNTFILNVNDPEEAPDASDFKPQRGVVMTVQVLKYELLAKWALDGEGYDETWEFQTVAEFMEFLGKFLTDGIDGV